MNEQDIKALGYILPRRLASGEWAALRRFIFTTGLVVGIERDGVRTRFCYGSVLDAIAALESWDGAGDPPGDWIKEKGERERTNPKRQAFKGVPIISDPE